MKTPDEILAILRADMQAAKERGFSFVQGSFGHQDEHTCCALTAGAEYDSIVPLDDAMERLEITRPQAWSVVLGYDGKGRYHDEAFHAIGKTLRAEFPPQS